MVGAGKYGDQATVWNALVTYLWPMQPLKERGLQGLRKAEAMINGQQAALGLVQAGQGTQLGPALPCGPLHQDVTSMPVCVEEADVQNGNAVHILQTEQRWPNFACVTVMGNKLL